MDGSGVGNGCDLSDWQDHWPGVYHKVMHWTDAFPNVWDLSPSEDPRSCLNVNDELQQVLWNIMLSREEIKVENGKRWRAYGPGGTVGHGTADGVEAYKKTRVEGWLGQCEAPEYEACMKKLYKEKTRAKRQKKSVGRA